MRERFDLDNSREREREIQRERERCVGASINEFSLKFREVIRVSSLAYTSLE